MHRNYSAKAQIIIRLIPGIVFLLEGIQKFLYPHELGVGRFNAIGISHADFWASFVGIVEILFGSLLIIGVYTRLATIPLLFDMAVAFVYTKWPILVNKGFFPMFHEYRVDFAMTGLLIYLLIYGGRIGSSDKVHQFSNAPK
jgi:uncharacterized membrane protein YphA (DoxX/SURF4 family)